jgi:hypothetical protein
MIVFILKTAQKCRFSQGGGACERFVRRKNASLSRAMPLLYFRSILGASAAVSIYIKSVFPVFVPSLSWQSDRCDISTAQKERFFLSPASSFFLFFQFENAVMGEDDDPRTFRFFMFILFPELFAIAALCCVSVVCHLNSSRNVSVVLRFRFRFFVPRFECECECECRVCAAALCCSVLLCAALCCSVLLPPPLLQQPTMATTIGAAYERQRPHRNIQV